jgi:hypothetical protein
MQRYDVEVAAATVNALSGSRVERVTRPSRVQLLAVQVTNTDRFGFEIGDRIIIGGSEGFADIQATARPIIPDNIVAEGVAMPGEQIRVPVTAVTTAVRVAIIVTPIQ